MMTRRSIRGILITMMFCAAGVAGQLSQAADPPTKLRQRYEALQVEFDKKNAAFLKASEGVKSTADSVKVAKLKPAAGDYAKRFLALANEKPDDAAALDSLVWIIKHDDAEAPFPQLDDVLELIQKHHLAAPALKSVVPSLGASTSTKAEALLVSLVEKGGDRDVRGAACFFLASSRYERLETPDEKVLAKVAALLERAINDYANVRVEDEDKPLGELADALLFEVTFLQPGKVAPEIEGTDVTGKRMKLSDQRGKIVMLVFWGSWCGPCMAEVPHERKLMTTFAGRPFTVIGINSGDSKENAAKAIKDNKMTWPSFFDGPDGPIVSRWNISSFPSVYLLDAKGVILARNLQDDEDADDVIAETVKAAEKK